MVAQHPPARLPPVRGLNPRPAMEPPQNLAQRTAGLRAAPKVPEAQVGRPEQLESRRHASPRHPDRVGPRGPVLAVPAPRRSTSSCSDCQSSAATESRLSLQADGWFGLDWARAEELPWRNRGQGRPGLFHVRSDCPEILASSGPLPMQPAWDFTFPGESIALFGRAHPAAVQATRNTSMESPMAVKSSSGHRETRAQ
jgi:hypothetical protein